MATETATPSVTPVTQTWLQKHERVIICALVLMVILWLGNRFIDSEAARSQAQASVAAQQAADAKLSAQQATAQAAQLASQYQDTVRIQQQEIAVLTAAVAQRNTALTTAQTAVKTAPLPQVATQWQTIIGGSGDITSSTTGLNVSEDGARRTVSSLLELPVVKANLTDETKIAQNTQIELDSANASIVGLNKNVTALNTQIVADDKQCKADIASVKADARKSKLSWFKRGLFVGFIGGLFAGHAAGI